MKNHQSFFLIRFLAAVVNATSVRSRTQFSNVMKVTMMVICFVEKKRNCAKLYVRILSLLGLLVYDLFVTYLHSGGVFVTKTACTAHSHCHSFINSPSFNRIFKKIYTYRVMALLILCHFSTFEYLLLQS